MAVPERIGRFDVEGRIGGGAFATVWRARDEALDSDVAIKVLSENWLDSADVRSRFLAEARLLRRAESDRVVRVHDLGELEDGRPYLVMTYADKGTLEARLADGRFAWRVATSITVEIGRGLAVLHAAGVLHRDIKPSNILYRSTPGGGEQVLLGDLGLGKLLAEASMLTLAGGTPAYMAPEQAKPGAPVSVRTDIYGLAALLYRLLTGHTTHDSTTLDAVADPNRPAVTVPSAVVGDIPPALDKAVLRALEPVPQRRHPDVDAFVSELRAVLNERAGAPGLTVAGPTRFTEGPEVTMPVHQSAVPPAAPVRTLQAPAARPSTPPQGFAPRPPTPPHGVPAGPPQTPPGGRPQQTLMYGSQPPATSTPQRGHPSLPPPTRSMSSVQPVPPVARPRKRRRWLVPVVAAVIVLAMVAAGGVWYYLQQPIAVTNHDNQVQVSVPRDWAKQSQDGWQPNVLTGTSDTTVGAGLLIAQQADQFSNTGSDQAGVFVGLLPPGAKLDKGTFEKKVAAKGCGPGSNPVPVAPPDVSSMVQQCGNLIMNDLLLSRKGRLVWVRIKQPVSDSTTPADIVGSLQINPL